MPLFHTVLLARRQGWFAIAFPWFCLPCPYVRLPSGEGYNSSHHVKVGTEVFDSVAQAGSESSPNGRKVRSPSRFTQATEPLRKKINACEMWIWRKMQRISWTEKKT